MIIIVIISNPDSAYARKLALPTQSRWQRASLTLPTQVAEGEPKAAQEAEFVGVFGRSISGRRQLPAFQRRQEVDYDEDDDDQEDGDDY